MSSDLKIELAKQEYVDVINDINQKYDLPLTVVEMLLNAILSEVTNMKIINITKEKEKIQEEGDKNGQN